MSKKSDTALAPTGAPVDTLATVDPTSTSRRGKENIDQSDLMLPRIAVAQRTSPELDPGKKDKYLDGLKLYQLFNTLTGEVYGNGPIPFVVVRTTKRALQFDADGNIIDFNVPWNDPRCEFRDGPDGKRLKPIATRFYEYLLVLANGDTVVLSLKSTQTKVAKTLNAFLALRPGDAWTGQYTLASTSKQSGAFTHGQYIIRAAGVPTQEMILRAEAVYTATEGRTIVTDVEHDDDDQPDAAEQVPF